MKKRIITILMAIITLTSILALPTAYAAWPDNQPPDPWANVEGPRYGGALKYGSNQEPIHLNPCISASGIVMFAGSKFYEPLVTYGSAEAKADGWGDGVWYPMIVESWESSSDGLTWTLHLQPDAEWHDGKPITSEDVLYSWEVFKEYHPTAALLGEAIKSWEAPDDKTVVLTMNYLDVSWRFNLPYMSVIPKHVFDITGVDVLDNPATREPYVGSGAFKFAEWKAGEYIRGERNDNYYKEGLPYLDEIYVVFAPDGLTVTTMMEAGEVDYCAYSQGAASEYARWRENPIAGLYPGLWGGLKFGVTSVMLNVDPMYAKYTSIKEFRQAMAYAVDYDRVIRDQTFGMAIRNPSLFPADGPNKWGFNPDAKVYDYDVDKANELLDGLGFAWDSKNEWRLDPDTGEPVEIRHVTGTPVNAQSSIMTDNWEDVGIKVNLIVISGQPAIARVFTDFDYDAYTWGRFTGPHISHIEEYIGSAYVAAGGFWANGNRYMNERVDELFALSRQEPDNTKAAEYFFEIQEILAEDRPNIPLYAMGRLSAFNQEFKGLYFPPNIDMHHDPPEHVWWVQGELLEPEPEPTPTPSPEPSGLEEKVDSLSGTVDMLSNQVDQLSSDIDALEEKVTTMPSAPTSLIYVSIVIALIAIVIAYYFGTRTQ
jgi:peptide/nickel transport system substrate-binding protein